VGPGYVLSRLFEEIAPGTAVLSVDSDSGSLAGLLRVAGAAFALGVPVDIKALFADRLIRPLPLDGRMTFLASPFEAAPVSGAQLARDHMSETHKAPTIVGQDVGNSTLDLLRKLVAKRVELPMEQLSADTHPMDDLHLSSIAVGQLVNDV